jgi:hypothetical protein
MLKLKTIRFALSVAALAIIVNLALSTAAFAHDKRWRGRGHDRKAEKFINGHDARDGRFDGRGPRGGFRDRRNRGEWRDRWRNGDWRRREILRTRRRHF